MEGTKTTLRGVHKMGGQIIFPKSWWSVDAIDDFEIVRAVFLSLATSVHQFVAHYF